MVAHYIMKPPQIRKGDKVRVIGIPPDLNDSAGIGTPEVFASAVGKRFHVHDISEHGLLELHLRGDRNEAKRLGSGLHVIWIEPQLVEKTL